MRIEKIPLHKSIRYVLFALSLVPAIIFAFIFLAASVTAFNLRSNGVSVVGVVAENTVPEEYSHTPTNIISYTFENETYTLSEKAPYKKDIRPVGSKVKITVNSNDPSEAYINSSKLLVGTGVFSLSFFALFSVIFFLTKNKPKRQ